jgi:hypothetical protein
MAILRETIVKAIETAFKTIAVANGYHTALASHVTIWVPRPLQQLDLPAVNIRDIDDTTEDISLGATDTDTDAAVETHDMTVELDLVASTATAIRSLIMDCRKALRDNVAATYDITPVGDSMEADQDEKIVVGATLKFNVRYLTALWGETS